MPIDINLLPQAQLSEERRLKLKKRVEIGSVVFLGACLLIIAGIFVYWRILTSQYNQIQEQVKAAEVKVNDYQSQEGLQRIFKLKITAIDKILKDRPSFVKDFAILRDILPAGVYFSDLTLESSGKLNLSGAARNSSELNTFLTSLTDPSKGGQYFTDVTLSSVVGGKDGSYKFSMTLAMKKDVTK